jgi:predicted transcriptional regulator
VETAKQEVQKILEHLPEDATIEDIQYHIYVRQKIEQGLADVESGRVLTQDQVEQRLFRWIGK